MRHRRRSLGRDGSPIARRAPRTCGPNCADSVCTIGGGPCQGVGGALAAPLVSLREALSSQKHQRPRFLCERSPARWLHAMAKYTLEGLSNTVLAAEHRTTLPNDRLLAEEIARTRRQLDHNVKTRFEHCHVVGALGPRGQGALPARPPPDRGRRPEARWGVTNCRHRGTSQPAPARYRGVFLLIPRQLMPPCARRLTNVPFCRPRDLLFQFIVRKVRRDSGTSGTGSLTDQSATRRPVYRFHVPELPSR
jgi:hypothetical protein